VEALFPESTKTPIKLDKNLSDILKESNYKKADERLALLESNTGIVA
jgi:hypothetical protein